jgi:DNA helicase-2/ATP-dependent DNA helicase PcrA
MPDPHLLDIDRGSVTAPAGCGKTELIKNALLAHTGSKPILVLTHTNAGVAALRIRLERAAVSHGAYELLTLDGWAMRLIRTFPARSGHRPGLLDLTNSRADYPAIRAAAANLIRSGHVLDVLYASYARLIVDEYQDCSHPQHAIVTALANLLPTCVLGDPLQAIFGFAEPLVAWEQDVHAVFPPAGTLTTPWRWRNAGTEALGEWLLHVRAMLLVRQNIDLREGPEAVRWMALNGRNDDATRREACRMRCPTEGGRVLVIGEAANPRGQQLVASQTPGAATVESVAMIDLISFGRRFKVEAGGALDGLLSFASELMTNLGAAEIRRRLDTLKRGTARNPATAIETLALDFSQAPSHARAGELLQAWSALPDVRVHRPAVLHAAKRAFAITASGNCEFEQATIRAREEFRMLGRSLPRRAVGSTLLLKGLEAEVAVLLHAGDLDAANLYVALTRGSTALAVCSRQPILMPHR